MKQIKNAVILAAGTSKRFGKNKLLEKIGDFTLPQYAVDFCIKNEIDNIYVTISNQNIVQQVDSAFLTESDMQMHPIMKDLEIYNYLANIEYKFQDPNMYGPAAAIIPHLQENSTLKDDFILLFGDNYYAGELEDFSNYPNADCIVSYKNLQADHKNLRFAVIKEGIVIEKPHAEVQGEFFCGYVVFDYEVVKEKIKTIELSGRNEYEITELINSIKKRTFIENKLFWEELTYENDIPRLKENILQGENRL